MLTMMKKALQMVLSGSYLPNLYWISSFKTLYEQ